MVQRVVLVGLLGLLPLLAIACQRGSSPEQTDRVKAAPAEQTDREKAAGTQEITVLVTGMT
jgi:hypothetical protein